MNSNDDSLPGRPYRVKTVRGEPYYVGERTLIPLARQFSYGQAKGKIGSPRVSGWGIGLVRVRPVAVLVETPEGVDRIGIRDATATILWRMIGAAGAVALLLIAGAWIVRRSPGPRTNSQSPST